MEQRDSRFSILDERRFLVSRVNRLQILQQTQRVPHSHIVKQDVDRHMVRRAADDELDAIDVSGHTILYCLGLPVETVKRQLTLQTE